MSLVQRLTKEFDTFHFDTVTSNACCWYVGLKFIFLAFDSHECTRFTHIECKDISTIAFPAAVFWYKKLSAYGNRKHLNLNLFRR